VNGTVVTFKIQNQNNDGISVSDASAIILKLLTLQPKTRKFTFQSHKGRRLRCSGHTHLMDSSHKDCHSHVTVSGHPSFHPRLWNFWFLQQQKIVVLIDWVCEGSPAVLCKVEWEAEYKQTIMVWDYFRYHFGIADSEYRLLPTRELRELMLGNLEI